MSASVSAGDLAMVGRAVAASGTGIAVADATARGFPLTYVNEAFATLTGYGAADCLERNCSFLQGRDTDPAVIALLKGALRDGRETRNVLLNYRKDGSAFFNEVRLSPVRDEDGQVVQVIGVQNDVSDLVSEQRALRLGRDHAMAELGVFQEALTPADIPDRPGLDLASVFLPAEQGVSGDFHLVAPGPGGSTIIVVGDAMGHGLHAARRATFVRASLATFARFTDDPRKLLELANSSLIEKTGTTAEFVTAACVTYEPGSGTMRWASAGHPVPLLLDTGQPIGPAGHIGIALGLVLDIKAEVGEIALLPGQGVLLATDGLSEARANGSAALSAPRLGDERITDVLELQRSRSAGDVVAALRDAARAHAAGLLADDLCIVAARARPRALTSAWRSDPAGR